MSSFYLPFKKRFFCQASNSSSFIGVSKLSQDFLKKWHFWKCLYKYFNKIPIECVFAACKKKLSYLLKYNFTLMKIFYTMLKFSPMFLQGIWKGAIFSQKFNTQKRKSRKRNINNKSPTRLCNTDYKAAHLIKNRSVC